MNMNNLEKYHLDLFGILALVIFTTFTFISVSLYPQSYSVLFDWLSNLGNVNLNPLGAVFFNIGCLITGILLIPFMVNLFRWDRNIIYVRALIILAMILGLFACISLIGVGIFPETHIHLHVLAATGVFESLFLIIILMTAATFNHPRFLSTVALIGAAAVIIDVVFIIVLSKPEYHDALATFHTTVPIPGLEWAAVFSALIWVAALSYNMYSENI